MERNQKVEDYMRTIYRLRENGLVRGAYIARELGVSKPTVCVALKEMEAAGYLSVQSDRTVELTEKGEKIGKSVIERNRVIFGLLTDLGVDKSIADADACKMEHGISDETLRALIELRQFLRVVCNKYSSQQELQRYQVFILKIYKSVKP